MTEIIIREDDLPSDHTVLVSDEDGNPEVIELPSSDGRESYVVRRALRVVGLDGLLEPFWICSCPAYQYGEGKVCKHLRRLGVFR